MTRPHRTARKSTGGKPPRKPLPSTPLNISAPVSTMPTPRVQPSNQVELNQSSTTNTNAPKAYRPLVKDFNMEDSGFDLSKVKMEKNSQETATVAPPSYLQRRIPVPEPPRQKIQVSLQMASNESSDSEEEEEETEQEASTTEKEHIEPVVKEKVVDQSQKESSSSSNEKPSEKPKENVDEDKDEDEDKEELPPNDDEDMEGKVLISHSYKTSLSNALELMS